MSLNWEAKRVLVLGAGVTGNAVAKSLSSFGALIDLVDENAHANTDFPILNMGKIKITDYDAVVVSPGWKSDHPLILAAMANGIAIDNEIDIAWRISQKISPNQKWLALTGTNGKTTTVEMAAALLSRSGFGLLNLLVVYRSR